MSQAKLTSFYNVRKKVPDQHAAKRRKILAETNVAETVKHADPTDQEPVKKKAITNDVSKQSEVVTSSTDDHALAPKTPTSADKESVNLRSSKRSSKEDTVTPTGNKTGEVKFTQGSGQPVSAKKKLDMNKGNVTNNKKNVEFTKLSQLSPKKKNPSSSSTQMMTSKEFKVPTPVKDLIIGARRPRVVSRDTVPRNLFNEDGGAAPAGPRPRRSMRAEIETAKSVAKKLTPDELKARLGTKNKSVEFRQKLKDLIQESNKVGDIKSKEPAKVPKLPVTPTKTGLTVDVPVSPSKAQVKSQVKASPRKVPAYERFSYLTQPVERSLPLPYKYRMLAEVFTCTDNVVSIYFNRHEQITYPKLVKSVQDMMRKQFGEKQLKQMKCVFPQAYFYAWHKILHKFGHKKEEYEMNIEPNLNYKNDILKGLGVNDEEGKKVKGKLTGDLLLERKNIFHNSLLQMVKDQHKKFLATLDPPISVDDKKLTRWHKDFDVESCSEVDTVELPEKPQVEKMVSAQQVLEKANQIFNLNPKLGESLASAAEKIQEKEETNKQENPSDKPSSSTPKPEPAQPVLKGLRGLNPKLLEKIRAKEAEKAKAEMTMDHAHIKKVRQLEKLPTLARTAKGLYVAERKASLPMELVLRKLVDSYPGQVDSRVMEEDVRALHKESDGWFRIQAVRNMEYCIINPSKDINAVCAALETKLKQAKQI
eukprot:TRINITY_DN7226_c0_g1_i4.p1 TRINITY_DN7226_c0_g1~~TRINITY_DN7226_c0_g1_i4.p1  ORF type:complete len:720 (+),score=223.47 TRINITY_DN7226_c0_g1_i4:51-2162(+)